MYRSHHHPPLGFLEILRVNGLGTALGTVALVSMDAFKPRFNRGFLVPRKPGLITQIKATDAAAGSKCKHSV